MASKTPIITSDVARIKELCNNNECLFFEVDNAEDLSKRIKSLLNSKTLQEKLIKNAYKKSKNYSYSKRCKTIIEHFYK